MCFWENFDLKNFERYCDKNNISYEVNENFILISTSVGNWMIEIDDNFNDINLLHKNLYIKGKNKNNQYGMEYHLQRKIKINNSSTPLMDIVEYIYVHDKDKYKKDYNKYLIKNKRLMKLFDEIK